MVSATRPNFYQEFTTKIEEEAKTDVKELSEDQQALAYITHFKGWELLETYAKRLEENLDQMVQEAMAKGLSMNEIGERTMVKELSKFVLNSFLDKAKSARRAENRQKN